MSLKQDGPTYFPAQAAHSAKSVLSTSSPVVVGNEEAAGQMEVGLEATKLGGNDHGHKRSDPEKAAGEVLIVSDAKRPREGNHDHLSAMGMEMDDGGEDEEGPGAFEVYYKNWLLMYGKGGACSFEAETEYGPMRYTDGPILPTSAGPYDTMEVFFVKVTEIMSELQWPLNVYGDVAVRDSLDRKRNYLFRRDRNKCQTLTSPQDSLLELTGPSRAILLRDEPVFEIDLKVKVEGDNLSSEDGDVYLCLDVFGYNNISYRGKVSYAKTEVVSSKHSTMEVKFAHVKRSIEATIMARITEGSGNFSARLTACSSSIGEDVVLLDSRGKKVSVIEDGKVELQRRVVVVEEQGELILRIKVVQLGDTSESSSNPIEKEMNYRARSAHRSEGYFHIGSCRLQMMVAWSYLP